MPACDTSYDCCPENDYNYVIVPESGDFQLTIQLDPEDGGNAASSGAYVQFSRVTVTAVAAVDFEFIGWYTTDNLLLSEELTYDFQITANTIIIARFQAL